MRLIDADAFKQVLGTNTKIRETFCKIIDSQPTAYDVEKVVEQEETFLVNFGVPKDTKVHRKIIDIVKRGGV